MKCIRYGTVSYSVAYLPTYLVLKIWYQIDGSIFSTTFVGDVVLIPFWVCNIFGATYGTRCDITSGTIFGVIHAIIFGMTFDTVVGIMFGSIFETKSLTSVAFRPTYWMPPREGGSSDLFPVPMTPYA